MAAGNHLKRVGILVFAVALLGRTFPAAADTTIRSDECGFTTTAPQGWTQIAHDVLEQRTALILGGYGTAQRVHWVAGYQRPATDWFHFPYELVGYMNYPQGVEPSESQIADTVDLLLGMNIHDAIRRGNSAVLSKITLDGGVDTVDWDADRHELKITMHVNVATWGLTKDCLTLYFGKQNAVVVGCYATDDDYDGLLPTFQKAADSFHFDPAFAYDKAPTATVDPGPLDLRTKAVLVGIVALCAGGWFAWKVMGVRARERARAGIAAAAPFNVALNTGMATALPLPTPPSTIAEPQSESVMI